MQIKYGSELDGEASSNRGGQWPTCKWGSPRKTTSRDDTMAKKISVKARAAARKQRDKWKNKIWYTIRAPRSPWDFKKIGETLGESDEHILGRVYEMTQQEFNGDFTKMHVILRFRVHECVGQDALTTFIGHHHQTDHIRRQIRRYRGKVDDVVDVVSTDGYLVRLKPLIITQKRVQTSVKQAMRAKARDMIISFASKSTFAKIQTQILDGTLEEEIRKAVKPIYPVKSVAIRKSQLLQAGVVAGNGKTLDEIHSEEARSEAEINAKKAAALATAMDNEEEEEDVSTPSIIDAAEAMEPASEKAPAEKAPAKKAPAKKAPAKKAPAEKAPAKAAPAEKAAPSADYDSMKVAELKELLKAAGKPVSGKKADLITRLNE
jgi:small subunit ribosomal protein S3Ae